MEKASAQLTITVKIDTVQCWEDFFVLLAHKNRAVVTLSR